MKIETYEIEPQSTEIGQLAADGEARMICERLGLGGQLALSDNPSETAFPYRHMTRLEQVVFEFHCPIKTDLKSYKSESIPVRVLQVAAHAHDLHFLKAIKVWHPKDARLDPVLVGYTSEYGGDLYLLARWGAVWKDFQDLLSEAKIGWAKQRKAKLEKASKEVDAKLATVDADAEIYFSEDPSGVDSAIYF